MFYYDDVQIEIVETVFTFSLYAKDLFKEENLLKSKLLESFNDDSQPFFDIVINIKKYFDDEITNRLVCVFKKLDRKCIFDNYCRYDSDCVFIIPDECDFDRNLLVFGVLVEFDLKKFVYDHLKIFL